MEKEKTGPMLNQPGQQRAWGFQGDTRPLLQEVFESSRQSMHRLARSTSPAPTILDSVAVGNTRLLIRLQNESPLSHEVQIGNQGPRKVLVRHTLGRHWVTPDAITPSVPHSEKRKRVVRCVCWLSEEPIVHRDRRNLSCLLGFRINSAVTKRKSSTTDAPQSTNPRTADETYCEIPLGIRKAKLEQVRVSILLPPEPHPHQNSPGHFHRLAHPCSFQQL